MHAWNRPFRALVPLALSSLVVACGEAPPPPSFPPTPVDVVSIAQERVTETREFAGRIQAVSTVELRPRVAGYLVGVHFEEGSVVEEGDLLFSIDAREYEAALAAARADVERATSRLQVATIEFDRNQRLIKRNAVSQGRLDAARVAVVGGGERERGGFRGLSGCVHDVSSSRCFGCLGYRPRAC